MWTTRWLHCGEERRTLEVRASPYHNRSKVRRLPSSECWPADARIPSDLRLRCERVLAAFRKDSEPPAHALAGRRALMLPTPLSGRMKRGDGFPSMSEVQRGF